MGLAVRSWRKKLAEEEDTRIRYYHFNCRVDGYKKPAVITLALTEMIGGVYIYGASACAPNDNFDKRKGRTDARRRLFTLLAKGKRVLNKRRLQGFTPGTARSIGIVAENIIKDVATSQRWSHEGMKISNRSKYRGRKENAKDQVQDRQAG